MKTYSLTIEGKKFEVSVNGIADGKADVTVNGKKYDVILDGEAGGSDVKEEAAMASAMAARPAEQASAAGQGSRITSPLPGVVIDICVKEGQTVCSGQKVAVLEAMKMENEIQATSGGTVTKIHVKTGDSVLEGAELVTLG